MTNVLETLKTTEEVNVPRNSFERVVGQEHAVKLVRSAVQQRRHVLLCGPPGIGKSMIAKAAYSILPPPKEEIRIKQNDTEKNRPIAYTIKCHAEEEEREQRNRDRIVTYMRPEDLPFEVAVKMGYRCPKCGCFGSPEQHVCMDCGSSKRTNLNQDDAYSGLFRMFQVMKEAALETVEHQETVGNKLREIVYQNDKNGMIRAIQRKSIQNESNRSSETSDSERVLVSRNSKRFIRVSGASPVELLGDIEHSPYGSGPQAQPAHMRVVPGAIHEAHEGILFVDEIASLGQYQKHLLTAMQDRKYPISGHNPQSSGASVRVDDVPCDSILFAACNLEDLAHILQPLRSRIRGYGYEIKLASWMEKSEEAISETVRFVAQTIQEDGRIPHFTTDALREIITISQEIADEMDGKRNALTLRLRELGGVVRVAGDLAVQENAPYVSADYVKAAKPISMNLLGQAGRYTDARQTIKNSSESRDYFF
ncbi:MAG: ATP-binding protein [Candidatus Thorarchaeota archaeon]|nr:ATP-binding protein [Candidatus Thorarchaeota archaeon]